MKNSRNIKTVTLFIAFVFCFSTMFSFPSRVAFAAEEIDVEAYERQLQEVEQQIKDAESNEASYQELADLIAQEIAIIDGQLGELNWQISEYQNKLDDAIARLNQAQQDLDNAVADRAIYQKKLEDRLAVMYMYGNSGFLDVLFGATSFSDFIGRVQSLSYIIKYDTSIADELKVIEETIEAKKLQIEAEKTHIEADKTILESKRSQLESEEALKKDKIAEAESNMTYWAAIRTQAEADETQIRRIIASVNGEGEYKNDFSHMLWPTPGYYSITDYYGSRYDPFGGGWTVWHTGIDVGAPGGAQIIAPGNGKVITSTYNGTYGNYVILSLGTTVSGNTITMLFGHMRYQAVSEGEYVDAGDVIGYVGTTGYSTGNHLHFTVRIDGVTVDPLDNDYVTVIK